MGSLKLSNKLAAEAVEQKKGILTGPAKQALNGGLSKISSKGLVHTVGSKPRVIKDQSEKSPLSATKGINVNSAGEVVAKASTTQASVKAVESPINPALNWTSAGNAARTAVKAAVTSVAVPPPLPAMLAKTPPPLPQAAHTAAAEIVRSGPAIPPPLPTSAPVTAQTNNAAKVDATDGKLHKVGQRAKQMGSWMLPIKEVLAAAKAYDSKHPLEVMKLAALALGKGAACIFSATNPVILAGYTAVALLRTRSAGAGSQVAV